MFSGSTWLKHSLPLTKWRRSQKRSQRREFEEEVQSLGHLVSRPISAHFLLSGPDQMTGRSCCSGQRVHLGFSMRCYGKIWMNFLASPTQRLCSSFCALLPSLGFFFAYLFYFFIYLAPPGLSLGTQHLWPSLRHEGSLGSLQHAESSSLTGDGTRHPCIRSEESQPLDHQGSPFTCVLLSSFLK